jgi:hypothetical protein
MSRLWMFLAMALPVLASVIAPMSTVDLTYHLRAGDQILSGGGIPTVDTWTFTITGRPWTDQHWAAQVVLESTERLAGWTGIVLLRAALTATIFGSLLAIAIARGLDHRLAAVLTIAAFLVAAPAMAMRPQLFGMACFALVLLLLTMRHTHPRALWAIPLVVALWANLHGSFFLGPLAVGLAWLEDVQSRWPRHVWTLGAAVLSVVSACLTPFGAGVWGYAVSLSSNVAVSAYVTEWQPSTIREPVGLLFLLSLAAVVLLIARRGRQTPWPTLLWIAAFAAIGLYAQRGIAWWALAAIVPVSGLLDGASAQPSRPAAPALRRLNLALVLVLAFAAIAALPIWRPVDRAGLPVGVLTDAPPGITVALAELSRPGEHVLAPQSWGSWIEYAVPTVLVGVDSRIELIPLDIWARYERIVAGADGWTEDLADWGVGAVVVEPKDDAFVSRLASLGWITAYADDDGVILMPSDNVPGR